MAGPSQCANNMLSFKITQTSCGMRIGPRLGRLTLNGRNPIDTPHYIGITSRGVVPHLSQDSMKKHTELQGIYVALEDFIERAPQRTPPILLQLVEHEESPMRKFIALPENQLLILGARRTTPVVCPIPNTQTAISISTSVGFGQIRTEEFIEAITKLKPDIVIGLSDVSLGEKPGLRRTVKMSGRTERWMRDMVSAKLEHVEEPAAFPTSVFAPILPISREMQTLYLDMLVDELKEGIAGLVFYDIDSTVHTPEVLNTLPKMSLAEPSNPHQLLREINQGIDLCTIPFISAATDAGIALDFEFPIKREMAAGTPRKDLGMDMWSPSHATDTSPLVHGCDCYACSKHHRAYIQHLFSAKEMLAWVLLQIHNLRVLDAFFAGIRSSIERGTMDEDIKAFDNMYERNLPEKTGQGPRSRGYQRQRSGPGEPKQNSSGYRKLLDGEEQNVAAPLPDSRADAEDLEKQGFGKSTSAF